MRSDINTSSSQSMLIWDGTKPASGIHLPGIADAALAKSRRLRRQLSRPAAPPAVENEQWSRPRCERSESLGGRSAALSSNGFAETLSPRYGVEQSMKHVHMAPQQSQMDMRLQRIGDDASTNANNGCAVVTRDRLAIDNNYHWKVRPKAHSPKAHQTVADMMDTRTKTFIPKAPEPTMVTEERSFSPFSYNGEKSPHAELAVKTIQLNELPDSFDNRRNIFVPFIANLRPYIKAESSKDKASRDDEKLTEANGTVKASVLNISVPQLVISRRFPYQDCIPCDVSDKGTPRNPPRGRSGVKMTKSGRPFLGRFKRLQVFDKDLCGFSDNRSGSFDCQTSKSSPRVSNSVASYKLDPVKFRRSEEDATFNQKTRRIACNRSNSVLVGAESEHDTSSKYLASCTEGKAYSPTSGLTPRYHFPSTAQKRLLSETDLVTGKPLMDGQAHAVKERKRRNQRNGSNKLDSQISKTQHYSTSINRCSQNETS